MSDVNNEAFVSDDGVSLTGTVNFTKIMSDGYEVKGNAKSGKNILIIDDLTETAGTITSAAKILRKHGALDIYAGVSHAVLTDLAVERLKDSDIKELIFTNSVPVRLTPGSRVTGLSVAELLGEGIRRIHDDESVSSLFELKQNK